MRQVNFRKRKWFIGLLVITIVLSAGIFILNSDQHIYPRQFQVGDRWIYNVLFPDSVSYHLTETIQSRTEINGLETYVFFREDAQHTSPNYLWLTRDWNEIGTYRPLIGNLQVSSTKRYDPPIELFHLPFRVGDKWHVDSTATTTTNSSYKVIVTHSSVSDVRETVSLEQVHTPAGNFRAFKITVMVANSPYEAFWFGVDLGQVVYAEYYNSIGEKVTQTLIEYMLMNTTSQNALSYRSHLSENLWQVICTTTFAVFSELKMPYE
jgi:hypothetical protein